ncbi:protein kinase, putative [Trichomonas vaginalis G3]|uniref:Protein kinase, putative n=1 Tax=Trichomonas vaginalis (strain ATCC PRA-98 / G3) TaxID=412133 RepID=A2EBR4_TRIV3|nr:protein serine/threonine kinase protein [Trichomonas vaginalis G3]EAY09876.1 protein kinase, putative [Trichomonas vaginalis G3]KAI5514678.1 protein serine/threonine kinase protein [Trichomonas vaginalis G3]|eukprot:XP_001322099.1 protein kinase [Trichomonas vaginalis G3]
MELCPTDLMKLAKHKISDSNLIKYVFEMIGCIKVCHDFNIAHNDIKPSNFLLDQYGHVKICDFGLSKIYTENPMSFDKKGSKYYMAPEMFTNGMYNPIVTDIWALGVTIYYLSTSTYPFDAETEEQLVEKINNCKYSTEKIKDDRLRDLIARCLVVNPNERANVNELLNMPYFSAPRANTWLEPGGLYKNRKICKTHDCILKPKIENNSPLYRRMFPHSHQARVRYTSNNF